MCRITPVRICRRSTGIRIGYHQADFQHATNYPRSSKGILSGDESSQRLKSEENYRSQLYQYK